MCRKLKSIVQKVISSAGLLNDKRFFTGLMIVESYNDRVVKILHNDIDMIYLLKHIK